MAFVIQDALTGDKGRVTSNGRFLVQAVTLEKPTAAAIRGDAYNFNSACNGGSLIDLSTASESGVWYFKNTDQTRIVVIESLFYLLGTSTGGTGEVVATVIRNPTGGTLVSGGTSLLPLNRNFASDNAALQCTSLVGDGSALTVTGGTDFISSIIVEPSRVAVTNLGLVLAPGNSIAVTIQAPTSNTSMNVEVAASLYVADQSVVSLLK